MGDVREGFGAAAVSVDAAAAFAELDEVLWDPIAAATVLRSAPRFDERVLDAAAGDGSSALPTAELVGPGGVVDAVDASEALVALLRERAGERMPQLRTHVGDPAAWPYTGYDLVQCVLGVFRFDEVEEGTSHLVECARPGGRVALTVWAHGALDPLGEVLASALPPDDERVAAFDDAARPTLARAETAGTFAQWVADRGLVDVRAEAVPRHLDLTDGLAWRVVMGTGLRSLLGELDDEAVEGVRERFAADLDARSVTILDVTTLVAVGRRPETS
ncbi:methyltransferase domain-containing protein [Agromyces aurantiacus]|uniref:Methyltransferase domain-containing protein n=1 Tax=Agromyces aurantiacus TaxID=165814 RepID=A0ABV9R1I8_9MICO|nr:class I SAM-dependent methyltransferase [Agromyces aurantiacus]MBM7506012.1 SAM-dependent methyltransferase [Agromyces aurantiacus]